MDYIENESYLASDCGEKRESELAKTRSELDAAMAGYANKCAKTSKLPVIGVVATTGVGKTRAACALAANMQNKEDGWMPIFFAVPTRNLVGEVVNQINGIGGNAIAYQPRTAPGKDGSTGEFTCWQLENVNAAGSRNHRPAQSLCRNCGHGQIVKFDHENDTIVADAKKWFCDNKLNPRDFENRPCRFLFEGNPRQMQAEVLVLPHAAFNDAIGVFDCGTGEKIKRFGIVDESFALSKPITITPRHICDWVEILLERQTLLQKLDRSSREGIEAELAEVAEEIKTLQNLSSAVTSGAALPADSLLSLYDRLADKDEFAGGTARWESVRLQEDDHPSKAGKGKYGYRMPLRAFTALIDSLKAGSVLRGENSITVFETSPILNWAIKNGRTMLLDATMPLPLKQIIHKVGGCIHYAQVKQNIKVSRVAGHSYGKGRLDQAGYKSTAQAVRRDALAIAKAERFSGELATVVNVDGTSKDIEIGGVAILHHKSIIFNWHEGDVGAAQTSAKIKEVVEAEEARFFNETGAHIGHFGRHHKGHNEWKFKHLVMLGMQILPEAAVSSLFAQARAGMLAAGVECDEWDGILDNGERSGGIPLPVDEFVRAWLVDYYVQDLVQAIGRGRGANSPIALRVELWGGLVCSEIDEALMEYGIRVEKVLQNDVHNSKLGRIRSAGTRDVIGEAGAMLQAAGSPVNRTNIRKTLNSLRLNANDKEIDARLVEWREAGAIPTVKRGRPSSTKPVAVAAGELNGCNYYEYIYSNSTQLKSEQKTVVVDAVAESEREWGVGEEVAKQAVETAADPDQAWAWSSDYSDYFNTPEYMRNVCNVLVDDDENEAVELEPAAFIAGAAWAGMGDGGDGESVVGG